MYAARHTSILFAAVVLLAPAPAVATLPPPMSFGHGKASAPVKRDRNYGPLGNVIARFVDQMFGNSISPSAATAFEEARQKAAPDGATLDTEAPQRRQYNYGLLGNLIAGLIDDSLGHTSAAPKDATTPPPRETLAVDTGSCTASEEKIPLPRPRRNYGPLGSLVASIMSDSPAHKGALSGTESLSSVAAANIQEQSPKPSHGLNALKGVRQFVKMLGSSFVPDTAFARAAETLKSQDQGLGIDAASGKGGFITPAELSLLLSRAKVNAAQS